MNDQEAPRGPGTRSGEYSLSLAVGSGIALLLPMVGEYVSAAFACVALVMGIRGIREHEGRQTAKVWPAIVGMVLAAVSLFLVALLALSR